MTRVRIFAVLMIAILAGGGLAYGTYDYLQNVPVKTIVVPTRRVVVANADLSLGRQLRSEDLTTVDWPQAAIPEGAFENPSDIVTRGLILSVVKHEVILPAKLASKEAGSGLPPLIPAGKRAVSVRVNEVIGVAGYVLPGTHVDVLTTANPTSRAEDMTTKVVLSNVEVLTAGTRMEQDTNDGKPIQVSVVTLLVTPDEAERLTLASTEGKIQLALRNPMDTASPDTPGIRTGGLMGMTAPRGVRKTPPPPGLPAAVVPPPTIEIIRGDKRSQVAVGSW
jgi:pilus assembly protein CpaB